MMKKNYGKMKILKSLKENNLEIITIRMQGWQLETFKESYDYKINKGISSLKRIL